MRYSELRRKDVINVSDGRKLGRVIDLILNEHACVEAIIVPTGGAMSGFFSREREGGVVAWSAVKRIGDDVILVELPPAAFDG